jgi:hypothetical protein
MTRVVSPAHSTFCELVAAWSAGSVSIAIYFTLGRNSPCSGDFFCLRSADPVTGPWTGL